MDTLIAEFNSIIERWKQTYLDDPQEGLVLAHEAVDCAQKLGKRFMARALAVRGSALKTVGEYNKSEEVLLGTLDTLDEGAVVEKVDLLRRIAYLRAEQRNFDQAIEAIEGAAVIGVDLPKHIRGTILLAKGYIYGEMRRYHEAIPIFAESLLLLSPKECSVSYAVAIHNLIVAISLDERMNLEVLKQLLRSLDSARRGLARKSQLFRLKLKWAGALADLRLGMNNKALSSLLSVRRELRRNRRPKIELAMISIDVAQAYVELKDFTRALNMLERALLLIEKVEGVNPSAVMSMTACIDSLRASQFTVDMLHSARRTFLKPDTVSSNDLRSVQYPSD